MASFLMESVSEILHRIADVVHPDDQTEELSYRARLNGYLWDIYSRIRRIRKRQIHLTFDDGPHPINTPHLLDVLKLAGIQATFFVVGDQLETPLGQELIHRAAAEGHQIGNHTYSHPHLTELAEDQIREEILRTEHLIGCAGRGIRVLRPPFGERNSLVDHVVEKLGYRVMLWDVDTCDWNPQYHSFWVEHAMQQIVTREQSIVLAHDIQNTTVTQVEALISQIRRLSGSSFVGHAQAITASRN